MPLPDEVATLLYCFNERDEILLLEGAEQPNRGFWSPPGGELHTGDGEELARAAHLCQSILPCAFAAELG